MTMKKRGAGAITITALASVAALGSTEARAEGPIATPPPAPAPAVVDRPAPRFTGKGLLIGAGVAGGVGLALNVGRIGWHLSACRPHSDGTHLGNCLVSGFGDFFLSIPAWFANLGAIGMAGGGGALKGRYEAYEGRKRDDKKAIIVGATLVGVGATVYIASRFARYAAFGCIDGRLGCYRGVYAGSIAGVQLGLTAAAVGAGILAFGVEHRRWERRYRVQVTPSVSAGLTGLVVSGRF